jgi:hypothetical protein
MKTCVLSFCCISASSLEDIGLNHEEQITTITSNKLRYRQWAQQLTYMILIWLYSRDQVNQACLIIPQGSILWLVIKTLSWIIIRNMVRSLTTLSFGVFSSTTIIEFGSIRRIIWTQFIVPSTNIHSHTHNLWGFTSEHEEASFLSPMDLLALRIPKTAKLQN